MDKALLREERYTNCTSINMASKLIDMSFRVKLIISISVFHY